MGGVYADQALNNNESPMKDEHNGEDNQVSP